MSSPPASPSRQACEIADRPPFRLHDVGVDVRPRQPRAHVVRRERLAVPVPRDVGIRVPGDEELDVVLGRPADLGQRST